MAAGNFDQCLAITLKWEGGYSNHPDDPGGATMRGITQGSYDAWRRRHNKSRRPVRQIEEQDLRAIYRQDYWDAIQCEDMPLGLDLCAFDAAVNSGVGRARQWGMDATDIDTFCQRRLRFLQNLGRLWRVFGVGWRRRIASIRNDAHRMSDGVTTSSAHDDEMTLHAGMRGNAVLRLQKRLRELGYPCGLVDGTYGEQTYRAVVIFQTDHELPGESGVWQPQYNGALAAAEPMLPKRRHATVKDLEAQGDRPVQHMNLLQRMFAWIFGASAATQIFQGSDVVSSAGAVRTALEPAIGLAAWASDHRWLLIAVAAVGLIALVRSIRADHVAAFQNFDYQGTNPTTGV